MGIEDTDKIVRITGDTGNLTIKLSPEEEKYRSKYLPDPKNLTDEKLVCTVCSVALAANVHKGKDIFVHRALHVLVCEACYNFYGDGCFSADEDGDDKYCRWCGQGGTLFLCSGCTCAFCEKCVKQNLKASVIADLEKDDWKCYICNPRPLFGCRTVCWGAGELNKIGKAKEQERLKKQKERLEKFEEKKKEQNERKSRKDSTSEGEHTTKKRKSRARYSDSSSVEIMPSKRPKRESRVGHLNNSTGSSRKKRKDSSSDDETSEEGQRKVTRRSKSNSTRKSRKPVDSDSEEDSDVKSKLKAKSKLKKKREKVSSDEFSNQQKTKYKQSKKKGSTSDEDSSDEKHSKKKKLPRKKKDVSSDSSDAKIKKKKSKNRKDSSCEDSDEANSDLSDAKEKKKKLKKRINTSSEDSDDPVHRKKKTLAKKKLIKDKNKINVDSDSESKKGNDEIEHLMVDEKSTEIKPKVNSIDSSSASENGIVKKRIQLAILWLNNIADDISELGTLISMRATNFSKKKINTEKLKTYDDVLNTVSKLKQLISGVHSNYDHIEKSLDAHLKPWKILTGLEEEPDIEHPARGETNVSNEKVPLDETVSGADAKVSQNLSTIDSGSKLNTKMEVEDEKKPEKIIEWSGLSADDDSDNDGTNALISKANETLDIFEEQENLLSDGKKDNASNPTDKNNSDTIKNKMASKDSSIKKDSNDSLHSSKVNLGDGSTRESNQSSSEEEASIKNKPMKNDTTVTLTSNTKSIKEDTNNKVEKKKSDKGGNSSDSEVESLQKKSKSPIKKCLKKGGEEVLGEKLKLCETKHAKKNASKALKGKCESTETISEDGVDLNKSEVSSDESSLLESFSNKLKAKWNSDSIPEAMNLKTSLVLDSSENSDESCEASKSEKKKCKKSDKMSEQPKKEQGVTKKKSETDEKKDCKSLKKHKKQEVMHVATENSTDDEQSKKAYKKKTKRNFKKEASEESDCDERKSDIKKKKIADNQRENKEEMKEDMEIDEDGVNEGEQGNSNDKSNELGCKEADNMAREESLDGDVTVIQDDMEREKECSDFENTLEKVVETNSKTTFVGLGFSDSEGTDEETPPTKVKGKGKSLKKRSVHSGRITKNVMLSSSDDEDQVSESNSKGSLKMVKKEEDKKIKSSSPVLLSSENSSDSEAVKIKKTTNSSDSDLSNTSNKGKIRKKRKLIRCADSSDETNDSDDEANVSKKSTQGESPGKGGRKNIKKIKAKDDLTDATKEAAEIEKERRKRIEERQQMFKEIFEVQESAKLEKLVLDFDPKEKKELISVNPDLVVKMKPHQAKGVKFMWDSCFESVSQLKTGDGSGCILAHCMGLGKTFQVISLVHTVLTHDETKIHTVMVVCPLSTVLNWYNEFDKWLEDVDGGHSFEVFHLTRHKQNADRARELRRWQHNGGVMIMGYEMFRNLTCETSKKFRPKIKKDFQETLLDPGADLIVCDEGHMLKNEDTALSKAMSKVRSLRRIVLTGTPMQNNLKEYHCMVQFVKPNLLGTRKEFLNRFVNPITNGQFVDSTDSDVKVMKRRAHVLHKMLEGLVQRFDYNVLTPFLPPKHEYVISVCLTELQVKLYKHYLENHSQQSDKNKGGTRLFQDWQALGRIWTHPRALKMSTDKANWLRDKKMMDNSDEDEEGSLKDFIDDGSEDDTTPEESSDDNSSIASIKSDEIKKKPVKKGRSTRPTRSNARNRAHLESSEEEKEDEILKAGEYTNTNNAWWSEMVEPEHLDDINHSAKLILLFAILKESEMIEDKILVFSQSLFSLDLIEYFLDKIDAATQANRMEESLGNHQGNWSKGLDYFRLDGSTSSENRNIWCKAFNREDNPRARLFLISTRAGGLGINLTGANRVIIFDASWNPSHDVQSIFRIYRFGQKKPCYVYRFIAHGTMEEKVYDRQVAKQSMSNRVVDEQQVHRHYSMNDLNELYSFTPPSKIEDRPTPALPTDMLMAEILRQFSNLIEKYHEHDSLLENVVEEELNEEERKLAWEDFENDKKRGFMPTTTTSSNYANTNPLSKQIDYIRWQLKTKYPQKSEAELNQMLVYQVSVLMRQQQQMTSTQGQASGSMATPQMFNQNMTPEQLFNLQQQQLRLQYMQQMQMKQAQQAQTTIKKQQMEMQRQANLARLQMEQMHQKFSPNLLAKQLSKPLNQQRTTTQLPQMNLDMSRMMELERMKKSYQSSLMKAKPSGVTITELPDDTTPSSKS